MEAERRQLTVLFADMVGFTAFTETAGEEAAYALMQRVQAVMTAAVRELGGIVKELTGDGMIALFGVPAAIEDGALRACRAALLIERRIGLEATEFEAKHGLRPRMRMGINAGTAVVATGGGPAGADRETLAVFGDVMNTAAHLQAIAPPGAILLGAPVHRLVQGLVDCESMGLQRLKGKAQPQPVFRLRAIPDGVPRFQVALARGLSRYVGRSGELEALRQVLGEDEGGLRFVDLAGEPGIGKSRLVHEFCRASAIGKRFVVWGYCFPDGREMPFRPFIEVVRGLFAIAIGESEAEVAPKLGEGLTELALFSRENLALLLNLLGFAPPDTSLEGLDGVLVGLRIRDLLQALLLSRSRLSPVLLVVEDLHWIDSASEAVLRRLASVEPQHRLAVIHTRRPEYRPPWIEHAAASLALAPLADGAISCIVQERLGADELTPELARLVAQKAGGNALFAEEIASFLLERRIVRATAAGLAYDPAAVAAALPVTIHSVLAARIDRLDAADRALLQAAAVIGRRFDPDVLAAVVTSADRLAERLLALQGLDLIQPGERRREFVFKHALVRDALYDSVLSGPRAALHLRIAAEIERRGGERKTEFAEVLAHHYGMTDRVEKAFDYLVLAGEKSAGVYSLEEAEHYFARALKLSAGSPQCAETPRFGDLMAAYMQVLLLRAKYRRMVDVAASQMARVQRMEDQRPLSLFLSFYSYAMISLCRFKEALPVALRALEIAEKTDARRAKAYAFTMIAVSELALARRPSHEVEALARKAVEYSEGCNDPFLAVSALASLLWNYFYQGLLVEGRGVIKSLLDIAQRHNDVRAAGFAAWLLGYMAIFEDDHEETLRCANETHRLAITPWDFTCSVSLQGIALTLLGNLAEGNAKLLQAKQMCIEQGSLYTLSAQEPVSAIVLLRQGQFRRGVKYLKDCIRRREEEGNRAFADWTRLMLAEVYVEFLAPTQSVSWQVVLRNLPFLVETRLAAAWRARALLERVLANEQFSDRGFMRARAHMVMGLVHKARGQRELARAHLERARRTVALLGPTRLAAKIEGFLGALAPSREGRRGIRWRYHAAGD